jgi:hypothetical protein
MCIFNGEVTRVGRTRLFAGASKDGKRQLTVYSNAVENKLAGNAMVLPVPNPESVQFHDLSAYKNFFDDCEISFYSTRGLTLGTDASNVRSLPYLRVESVGSYQVSLANTLDDLKRTDPAVFQIAPGCESTLRKHYSDAGWGFIICKIKEGSEEYHPFGYSHTVWNGQFFLPTRHYHGSSSTASTTPMEYNGFGGLASYNQEVQPSDDSFADDWDHTIYLYNAKTANIDIKLMDSSRKVWDTNCEIPPSKIPGFTLGPLKHFRRIAIHGNQPNLDIQAPILA